MALRIRPAPRRLDQPDPRPASKLKRWLGQSWWQGLGVLVAVLTVVITMIQSGSGSDGARVPPGPSPSIPESWSRVIGDPHTADPCALVDAAPLGKFGETEVDSAYAGFNRCDVIVRSGQSEVDVALAFDDPLAPGTDPPGQVEKAGGVTVFRKGLDGDKCVRTVVLADRYRVEIWAKQNGDGPADLCAMAEAATATATRRLLPGKEIPRRSAPPAAGSLIGSDACDLLDPTALGRFPGVDAAKPDIGFGNWACRWHSTLVPGNLLMRFDRNEPLNTDAGSLVRLGSHRAFVKSRGDGDETCVVKVINREYTDSDDRPLVELLVVVATSTEPADQRCDLAVDVARPAAAKLPR